MMPPNWAQIVSAAAAVGALLIALLAWANAVSAYRTSFQPVLRPVPKRNPNDDINPSVLFLKNIGRGAAVSVFLVEAPLPPGQEWPPGHPGPIVTTVDVVEPLGSALRGGGEGSRIGRVVVNIPPIRPLRFDADYRLLYQDITGAWHETTFRLVVGKDGKQVMRTRYLGRLWWPPDGVPKVVYDQGQIVQQSE
jgi:hypothetical protein